ncbi:angiogenin-like [Anolis sagrei]|uniref:angiogenin-like n=1 Tax=Anolis sagrei TaxID=38937 RepID=UPI003521931F
MMLPLKRAETLMLILVLACVIASGGSSQNPRHEKFWRQHHDFPRTNMAGQDYCGTMMLRRGMARPCKDTNSFVHVPKNQLKDICGWAGTHYRRALRISREPLHVTTCKLQGTLRGQCRYWSHTGQRHIHIGCDASGWPIRFEETNFM